MSKKKPNSFWLVKYDVSDHSSEEKLKKAEKLGVKIISEDDFEKMLDK